MAVDVEKLKGDVHIPAKTMFKRIYQYFKPEIAKFIGAMLLIVLNVVLDTILPLFVSSITNNLKSEGINLDFIIGMAVTYLAIGIFNQAFLVWESAIAKSRAKHHLHSAKRRV